MKELGLIDRVLQMLASDKDFCLHAMECGFPSPFNYMLEEKDGMDSILYMATDHYGRKFSSPSDLHNFLGTRYAPVILDRDEMHEEFVMPAKGLILSVASDGYHGGMMGGSLKSANRIRSYFAKVRGEIGYPRDISEAQSEYDKEDIIAPFVARKFQYFAGVAEFIESMNRFTSSHSDECINEEMAIMLGIMERWEDWELLSKKPLLRPV